MTRASSLLWLAAALLSACTAGDGADETDVHTDVADAHDADRDGHAAIDAGGDDCDDARSDVFPGAPEVPADGVDGDCDGAELCPADADGDGHGGPAVVPGPLSCEGPGTAVTHDDCDDTDDTISPTAREVCDGRDEDCSGRVDDVEDAPTWQLDRDGDGRGDPTVTYTGCTAPPAFVAGDGSADCDDLDRDTYPGAPEVPGDGIDQDCDTRDHCWDDLDVDGVGAGLPRPGATLTCDGAFESPRGDDCDDADEHVFPDAPERCGAIDHDCDELPGDDDDDATDPTEFYADFDGDGFGNAFSVVAACVQPPDMSVRGDDCNDDLHDVYPGAPERCDFVDNDCDDATDDADDDVVDGVTWHRDRDGDGFGSPTATRISCLPFEDWNTLDDRDCDDSLAIRNPSADEQVGNALDEDCDGTIACYVDADGDGAAGLAVAEIVAASCARPGYGTGPEDCDDADPARIRDTWYADGDRDGWGNPNARLDSCVQPALYVSRAGDCNDTRGDVNPDATELAGDGRDSNCDGRELCWPDVDRDGYGRTEAVASEDAFCLSPGESTRSDDCDDEDPAVRPGATEGIADGVDQDCDGFETCFYDADADGWGVAVLLQSRDTTCVGTGVSPFASDCAPSDPSRSPGAAETCNTRDDDCDGLVDDDDPSRTGAPSWSPDLDDDGLGDRTRAVAACLAPPQHVANAFDCDDTRAAWGAVCPWREVWVGTDALCLVRTDHTLWCEGDGPVATAAPPHARAVDVEDSVACAVDAAGALACWGADDPRAQPPTGAFLGVSLGARAACAVGTEGTLTCWGDDASIVDAAPAGAWVEVGVGDGLACARGADGGVSCWGTASTCVATDALPSATALVVAGQSACVRDARGALACEGCDARATEAPAEPLLRFLDIAVGIDGGCAVTVSGDPTCWGGVRDLTPPAAAVGLSAIDVGDALVCGLDADAFPVCW